MAYSRLLDRIGIPLPIIQAPMAGVSTPAMAATVSEAADLDRSQSVQPMRPGQRR
jgi:NAD(P)H-dependent flavin oxidoreductase YrpB (nitropropane dioxygenase family)